MWSENKRIEAVTTYLILGNLTATAAVVGVPHITLRMWKREPWWAELTLAVQTESDQELDSKLAKRIEKALDLVNDRLENGDFQYDPKTGQFVRKPVSVKDGWKVANEMIDKRWLLRKQPSEAVSQEAVTDILKNLAQEFSIMAKKRMKEVVGGSEQIEAVVVQELPVGIPELPRSTPADPSPVGAQPSSS